LAKKQAMGFGYIPKETKHHFLIHIPKNRNAHIVVYERFEWDEAKEQKTDIEDSKIKTKISRDKWDALKDVAEKELNRRLRTNNIIIGKFKSGNIPLEGLLGKELVLLLWAIEDADPSLIKDGLINWLGLSPEERWYLFTMTNAATGHYLNKRGWRKAVRFALTENPTGNEGGEIAM